MIVHGTHDGWLVALSVLVAIAASYTALDLASRIQNSIGRTRLSWLVTAAIAMGGGIWAMHFIAMLAFGMPMRVSYDVGLTIVSLLLPILVTGFGFFIVSQRPGSLFALLGSGLVMGIGIVLMHYMGMAAMRMPAALSYDRFWVAVSVLIAIGAATVALWLAGRDTSHKVRAIAAVVMGFAISGMHYTAMVAATFTGQHTVDRGHGAASIDQTVLALGLAALTFFILFLAWAAALFDRRFAAIAVREALAGEERFRNLYKRTPLPLFSLNASGLIDHVSEASEHLLGYERQDIMGQKLDRFMTPESAETYRSEDWPRLMAGHDLNDVNRHIMTKTGSILDACVSIKAERDACGQFLRGLGGIIDMTERRRTEAALVQAQKMEVVGQLTGGVAHDFNNLLMAITGNLELATKRTDDDTVARYLDRAQKAAFRGAKLTQQLLAFSRRQRLTAETVDVNTLIENTLGLMNATLGGMVRVQASLAPNLWPALADPTQLDLIVLNLAINARDAMPDGGIITVRTSNVTVPVRASATEAPPPGEHVMVAVSDTGTGMSPEVLGRVFEPFFTTKDVGKGSGLGLPQVLGLAKQLGGGIEIDTAPGKGTEVRVYFPRAKDIHDAKTGPTVEAPDLDVALRVLLVDDDEPVRQATAAMLLDMGCEVVEAVDGLGAIEIAEADRPDVVLMDEAMPGLTGSEAAARLRTTYPDLRIILISGFASSWQTPDKLGLPRLQKPFAGEELKAVLAGQSPGLGETTAA
ncbi:MHYT domain-containing protein [Flaviflagellibacter deserti]|uniref:histidine kinase n=1 Tax=Flaviflagellibacter deserti TaxID=2267266 RepID=A0ABV9Z7S7_9HYPH